MKWSLKLRLNLLIATVMTLFIMAAFAWMHFGLSSILDAKNRAFLIVEGHEFQSAGQDQANGGIDTLEAQIRREAGAFASEGLVIIQEKPGQTEVFPTTDANLRLASAFRLMNLPEINQPVEIRILHRPFLVHKIWIEQPGLPRYPFYLMLSLHETQHILREFDLKALAGGLACLLLALAGGTIFTYKALKPVVDVIQSAQRLKPDQLQERLPLSGSGDEIDELAGTINKLLERLATYHTQMTRFTADASHELRSPLGAMRAMVEVALQQPRNATEYRDVLESLGEQCDRLSHLVDGLLLLARADAGQVELKCEMVDLGKITAEMIDLFEPLADEKGVALQWNQALNVHAFADPQRIRQLVTNLVDNAIKFTNPGGHVTVSLQIQGGLIAITVDDNGIGIQPDQLHLVFERFFQADSARSSQGSGLGLSICHWICQAHGGSIHAESKSPSGTRIVAQLPARK